MSEVVLVKLPESLNQKTNWLSVSIAVTCSIIDSCTAIAIPQEGVRDFVFLFFVRTSNEFI